MVSARLGTGVAHALAGNRWSYRSTLPPTDSGVSRVKYPSPSIFEPQYRYCVPEYLLPVHQEDDADIRHDKTFDPARGNSACFSLLALVGEFDIVLPRRTDLAVSRSGRGCDGGRLRVVGRELLFSTGANPRVWTAVWISRHLVFSFCLAQ